MRRSCAPWRTASTRRCRAPRCRRRRRRRLPDSPQPPPQPPPSRRAHCTRLPNASRAAVCCAGGEGAGAAGRADSCVQGEGGAGGAEPAGHAPAAGAGQPQLQAYCTLLDCMHTSRRQPARCQLERLANMLHACPPWLQVVRDINERQARELGDAADEAKRLKEQVGGRVRWKQAPATGRQVASGRHQAGGSKQRQVGGPQLGAPSAARAFAGCPSSIPRHHSSTPLLRCLPRFVFVQIKELRGQVDHFREAHATVSREMEARLAEAQGASAKLARVGGGAARVLQCLAGRKGWPLGGSGKESQRGQQ